MSDNYIRFVKVKINHSLGVRRSAEITGRYTSREAAEQSPEKGKIYPAATGYKLVKDANEKVK